MTQGFAMCTLAIVGAVSAGALQSSQRGQSAIPPAVAEQSIQETFSAYAAGDDLAVERWLSTPGNVTYLTHVEPFFSRQTEWSRARAAFVLEIVILRPLRSSGLLRVGQAMVMSRPQAPGTDPVEDRFEVLWHQAAVGVAEGLPQFSLLEEYLDDLGLRFDDAPRGGVMLETRIPLARAFATSLSCCWKPAVDQVVREIPRGARGRSTMDAALSMFLRAADLPTLRVEALIRGGKLLHDAGRNADALAWFDRVGAHDDTTLGYVQHLTRARVLDALDRPADAAAAYAAALTHVPRAQRAAIGLAAALLRTGAAEEAAHKATDARRMSDDGRHHIAEFQRGDHRFVRGWLLEIRKLR